MRRVSVRTDKSNWPLYPDSFLLIMPNPKFRPILPVRRKINQQNNWKTRAAAWGTCATPAVKPASLQHRLLFNRELPIILPTTLPPLQIVSTNLSCPQVLGGNRVSTIDTHVYILMFNSVPLRTYAERSDYLNLWRLRKVFTERCMDSLNWEKYLKVSRIRPPVLLKAYAWKNKGLGVLTFWFILKGIIWKSLSLVFRARRGILMNGKNIQVFSSYLTQNAIRFHYRESSRCLYVYIQWTKWRVFNFRVGGAYCY